MSEIRRMPKPEFERPKRRVSYPVYFVCTTLVGLLWIWLEDAEVNYATAFVAVFGLMTIGKGMARFIADEIAISRDLRILKDK